MGNKNHQLIIKTVIAFVVVVFFVMTFVNSTKATLAQGMLWVDDAILLRVYSLSSSTLDTYIPIATNVGGVIGVSLMLLVATGGLLYTRKYHKALFLNVSVIGALVLNVILKAVFQRVRPDLWDQLIYEPSYSFPSGHAMASAALGIAIVVVLWNSRWRWWALACAILYIIFVGFSRLYLGVHYPTDIVAGWFVSAIWIAALGIVFRTKQDMRK